ncbi:MAG: YHS domain-containing protein [Candidatus Omnitrophota bacterium]
MKTIYLVILGLAVFTLVSSGAVFSMSCCAHASEGSDSQTAQEKSTAVDAGNKICPVTGEKIDEASKATYEFEGKIYNFCCAMCIDEFKKEPQKYIDKVDEELQVDKGVK